MTTDELLKKQFNNLVQQTLQDKYESAKNQDFLQNNNVIEKKVTLKLYTTTRIKARNFLSNIAYKSVNDQDIFDRNFCFECLCFGNKKSQSVFFGKKNH